MAGLKAGAPLSDPTSCRPCVQPLLASTGAAGSPTTQPAAPTCGPNRQDAVGIQLRRHEVISAAALPRDQLLPVVAGRGDKQVAAHNSVAPQKLLHVSKYAWRAGKVGVRFDVQLAQVGAPRVHCKGQGRWVGRRRRLGRSGNQAAAGPPACQRQWRQQRQQKSYQRRQFIATFGAAVPSSTRARAHLRWTHSC